VTEYDLALFLLRVALGLTSAAHGANKYMSGLDGVAGWFDSMGIRPGAIHARFAAGGGVLTGLFLAADLLTSFAALGLVGPMTIAAVTVHLALSFFVLDEGWEYVFILGVTAVAIALIGPGSRPPPRASSIGRPRAGSSVAQTHGNLIGHQPARTSKHDTISIVSMRNKHPIEQFDRRFIEC
jgi:putative oxidoreductase